MVMVLLSWLAFFGLNYLKPCQRERVTHKDDDDKHMKRVNTGLESESSQSTEGITTEIRLTSESFLNQTNEQNISKNSFAILLTTQAYICALTNGVLPSNQLLIFE